MHIKPKKTSIFILLLVSIFFVHGRTVAGEAVSVKFTAPTSAASGSEINIDATISKSAITGFAKFQIELPDGFSGKQVESKGGSFTNVDQKIKIIWMSLPTTSDFSISFKIISPSSFSGPFELNGSFSYVENNETQKYKIPSINIQIGAGGGAPTAVPVEKAQETTAAPASKEPANTVLSSAKETTVPVPVPAAVPAVAQSTPAAAVPSAPSQEEEVRVVSVISSKGKTSGTKPETSVAKPPIENTGKKTSEPKAIKNDEGIIFRVQLANSHKPSDGDSLKAKAGVSTIYAEPSADGMTKFTAGNFKQYSDARDLRNEVRQKGIAGAFIIAYRSGSIINLQEALKESGQKWVP